MQEVFSGHQLCVQHKADAKNTVMKQDIDSWAPTTHVCGEVDKCWV